MEENFESEQKITKVYRAIQMDTFNELDTAPEDWQMCEIIDMFINPSGIGANYLFDIPEDYILKTPFTDKQDPHITEELNEAGFTNCQLCGHIIIYECFIKCDKHKIVMAVGSECVNNFEGAGYFIKEVKKFKDSTTKEKFLKTVDDLITQCKNHKNGNSDYIQYPYFKFIQKLEKVKENIEEYSSRKLGNLLKKAEKDLKLNVGRSNEDIEKEKLEKENKEKARIEEIKKVYNELLQKGLKLVSYYEGSKTFMVQKNIPDINLRNTLNYNEAELVKSYGGYWSNKNESWMLEL